MFCCENTQPFHFQRHLKGLPNYHELLINIFIWLEFHLFDMYQSHTQANSMWFPHECPPPPPSSPPTFFPPSFRNSQRQFKSHSRGVVECSLSSFTSPWARIYQYVPIYLYNPKTLLTPALVVIKSSLEYNVQVMKQMMKAFPLVEWQSILNTHPLLDILVMSLFVLTLKRINHHF